MDRKTAVQIDESIDRGRATATGETRKLKKVDEAVTAKGDG